MVSKVGRYNIPYIFICVGGAVLYYLAYMLPISGLTYVLVAAGGVAANSVIRADLERACARRGYQLYLPPLKLCGDNGAMIGAQGYYEYLAGHIAGMELNAYATRDIADGI